MATSTYIFPEAKPRQHLAHVPKKACQHGLFRSSAEEPPPSLKPGQTDLRGSDVFMQEAQPYRETYLTQDQVRDSTYMSSTSRATEPEDYTHPVQPYKPKLVADSHAINFSSGTTHWKSEYKASTFHKEPLKLLAEANLGLGGADHLPQGKPFQMTPRGCGTMSFGLGRTADASTYTQDFGKFGSDPRNMITPGATELPIMRSALTAGTNKGTRHLPGYQGFVPSNLLNKKAAQTCEKDVPHEERRVDKIHIEQIFHQNLVGYCGHTPDAARNDRGGRHPSELTVFDRDFTAPRSARMKDMVSEFIEKKKAGNISAR